MQRISPASSRVSWLAQSLRRQGMAACTREPFLGAPGDGRRSNPSHPLQLFLPRHHHHQNRQLATQTRRKRKSYEKYPVKEFRQQVPEALLNAEPFTLEGETLEDYIARASLSPWAPMPESAYMKYFDMAQAGPDDIHVDLGCGDGRVNFHAVDNKKLKKSIGIDVDENILARANERLNRRHPKPDNIKFYLADLMDKNHPVWDEVREATIITMFFADTALKKFLPTLEEKLEGVQCQILTGGYAMPTWDPDQTEVVLGTKICLYRWGYDEVKHTYDLDEEEVMDQARRVMAENQSIEKDEKFKDYKIIDHTNLTPQEAMAQHMEAYERESTEWEEWEKGDPERKIVPEEGPTEYEKEKFKDDDDRDVLPGYWEQGVKERADKRKSKWTEEETELQKDR